MIPINIILISKFQFSIIQFKEAVGTVQRVSGSTVTVYFKGLNKRNWRCDSSNLVKLNKFSLNELIRIRSDPSTLREIRAGLTYRRPRRAPRGHGFKEAKKSKKLTKK